MTGDGRKALKPGNIGDNVRTNVRLLREARRLSVRKLSAATRELGWTVHPTTVTRIELGARRVDVDDLVALAAVLGVAPAYLLEPAPECVTCHGAPPPGFACTECGVSADGTAS